MAKEKNEMDLIKDKFIISESAKRDGYELNSPQKFSQVIQIERKDKREFLELEIKKEELRLLVLAGVLILTKEQENKYFNPKV